MSVEECYHIRIRDSNNYRMKVERTIKHLENLYQMDFRNLPHWEQLVQRLHLAITDCKRKIQDSKYRKAAIIDKLCIESCRPSPFELTDQLARTAKTWQLLAEKMKRKSIMSLSESAKSSLREAASEEMPGEGLSSIGTAHQNTEELAPPTQTEENQDLGTIAESKLPTYVCLNQHKRISVLNSSDSPLRDGESDMEINYMKREKQPDDWLILPQSTNIISTPNKIIIRKDSLEEQTVSFSLVNCSNEYPYLNIRFKGVTDKTPFRRAKILPATPIKLFAGVALHFEFVFKLEPDQVDFTAALFFKVGQKVYAEAPVEGFRLPVISMFTKAPASIRVSQEVNIPSAYFWHVNARSGFPCRNLNIQVPDHYSYDLLITKLSVNLAHDSQNDMVSIEPMPPSSMTVIEREQDEDIKTQIEEFVPSSENVVETESVLMENAITEFINDAIQRALDVFLFKETFIHLEPYSKQSIKVYQTKVEHIGFHQSFYELRFLNPSTGEEVFYKTTKVFGEVMPSPIQIQPILLDMTVSPIVFGRCEDHFTLSNNHKIYPVTIKIKLTKKMKGLIRITPMETLISAQSSAPFFVGFCSKDLNLLTREYFVHLNIKIKVIGDKSVYRNYPQIYYEILAPCSLEYMKLYKKEVFE